MLALGPHSHPNTTGKVKAAVLTAPYLIPYYLKSANGFNPKQTMGVLRKLLPFRSSIEIECFKSLQLGLKSEYGIKKNKTYLTDLDHRRCCVHNDTLETRYKIYSYNEESCSFNIREHQISIRNFKQLNGLYNVLNLMKQHCELNMGSGIHVHIDINQYCRNFIYAVPTMHSNRLMHLLQTYLHTRLDDIYQIFGSSYDGSFNQRGVAIDSKTCWVNIRRPDYSYGSIEFRIGDMTFEYETIIKWLIGCNSIVKDAFSHPVIRSCIDKPTNNKSVDDVSDLIKLFV